MTDVTLHHYCDYCSASSRQQATYLRISRGRTAAAACETHLGEILAGLVAEGGEITTVTGQLARFAA